MLLVVASSAAAVLVAGLALPAVVGVGVAARVAASAVAADPAELDLAGPAEPSVLYAADGTTVIATFYSQYRRAVPLGQIAPVMRKAIVAAEDRRFYQHGAVDARGVLRAAAADLAGGAADQGASTLTMQYVRNVLKNDPSSTAAQRLAATADTLARKLRETQYAADLERRLSKDDILTRYLNIVYFGAGAYGVDAASLRYFSVPAAELTLPQAALLAGLVQAPDTDSPLGRSPTAARSRRAYVLASMRGMGEITAAQQAAAGAAPLGLRPQPRPAQGCAGVPAGHDDWGFFCDYVLRWWDSQSAFGATPAAREATLRAGGYRIVGSLDPTVQASALAEALGVYGYDQARALPIAAVQPGTGRVLALAVNRHYGLTGAATVAPLISGGPGVAGYPTGSTFKLFTMLAALQAGLPLDTEFDAPARLVTHWPDDGPSACGGSYCPQNENPAWMDGPRTMWTGFGRSVNTYFVHLEEQVGADRAVAVARALGITFRAASDARLAQDAAGWGAFTLGVADTTPLDLAEAYATLGADGVACAPLPVDSVVDGSGRTVPGVADPRCHQAVSAGVAQAAADAARCPVGQQSAYGQCDGGTAEAVSGIVGGPVAGKTGSTQGNVTETFVGVTPQVAAAGIAADPADPGDGVGAGVSAAVDA
ncbi:MAG: hypothetical protein V7637_229, partial [Mycobacteriales bacterium]